MFSTGNWLLSAVILGLYVFSLVVVYRDAKLVGKDPIIVTLLCALCGWPVTLILWMAFRPAPPVPAPAQEQAIECVQCRSAIPSGQSVCPKCGWSYKG